MTFSNNAPVCTVTFFGDDEVLMLIAVRNCVVSTKIIFGQLTPFGTVNGAQLCMQPRGRTL
jgi:hypothetical protein